MISIFAGGVNFLGESRSSVLWDRLIGFPLEGIGAYSPNRAITYAGEWLVHGNWARRNDHYLGWLCNGTSQFSSVTATSC